MIVKLAGVSSSLDILYFIEWYKLLVYFSLEFKTKEVLLRAMRPWILFKQYYCNRKE